MQQSSGCPYSESRFFIAPSGLCATDRGSGAAHNSVDTTQAPMLWGIWSLQEVLNWNTGWREHTSYYPPDYFKDRWHWMWALNLPDAARKAFVIAVMEVGEDFFS